MPLYKLMQQACQLLFYLKIENKISLHGSKYGGFKLFN